MPVLDALALIDNRVSVLRAFHERHGFERAELDVSGGIDSAVMLHLLCRALSPEQVTAVFTGIHSSADSRQRAQEAAASCGVKLVEVEMTEVFEQLQATMLTALAKAGYDENQVSDRMASDPTIAGSIRSCLRAPVGRGLNRMTGGGVRHGTGNECEDRFLRFYQKGGDGEVDSNPIAMLSKGEVFQLAHALGVPQSILEAVPSPDLHGNGATHNDEDELRKLYGLDWTYSKVHPANGNYTFVGSIERMSRLLDEPGLEAKIFGDETLSDATLDGIVKTALERTFHNFSAAEVRNLVLSAQRIERSTRHKINPNCPSYGTREELIDGKILSNSIEEL